ncbi:MAG: TIGR02996 domain-containing protein [Myxococcaceae bacterium]
MESSDGEGALALLLDVWARERLPKVRDAIVALSKAMRVETIKQGGSQKDDYLAWTERARAVRPADVQLLAETLLLASARERAQEHFIRGRLKLLAKFPADPRAAEMIELLDVNMPGLRWSADLERALKRHALPPRPGARSLSTEVAPELEALELSLRKAKPRPVGAPIATAPGAETPESLIAAVYADPFNDELRLIAADKLSEAGDPRGEFITLQFQRANGNQSREGAEREIALRNKHGAKWLGHLGSAVVKSAAGFEKGFVAVVHTTAKRVYQARESMALDEWATVRKASFNDVSYFSSKMKSLRVADGVSDHGLRMLAELDVLPPLEEVSVYPTGDSCSGKPAQWTWPATLARLTQLRDLEIGLPGANWNAITPEQMVEAVVPHLPRAIERFKVVRTPLTPMKDRERVARLLTLLPRQLKRFDLPTHWFKRVEDGSWEQQKR